MAKLIIKNAYKRSQKRSDRSKQVNLRTIYPTYLINNFLREYDKQRATGGNSIGFTT